MKKRCEICGNAPARAFIKSGIHVCAFCYTTNRNVERMMGVDEAYNKIVRENQRLKAELEALKARRGTPLQVMGMRQAVVTPPEQRWDGYGSP